MPDLSRNLVYLRWLLKLVDFRATGELSWGSAVLATLYKEMCGVMRPNKAKIGGCLYYCNHGHSFTFYFYSSSFAHLYLRHTLSIFHAESVLSLWKTCSCNWDCQWIGTQSLGSHHLLIGEPSVTSFWVLFRIILTEVRSRWASYETHFRSRIMIRLN
ncbi:hypothetical protein J1N35_037592 [Gossypium stocksii]|uniref:Aminotransferase-like plant mobile domain-containing protein n=1 Tax=Gossypium stocksii TaxID=47602 RepID=A0A9D3UKH7_9ROSI|nr:hypothetical protein J1N35_037592 [Gossypium stocksii]